MLYFAEFRHLAGENGEERQSAEERRRRILALEGPGRGQGHLHLRESLPYCILRSLHQGTY